MKPTLSAFIWYHFKLVQVCARYQNCTKYRPSRVAKVLREARNAIRRNVHCKNKKSRKPPSSAYTEEKFRMENPDFRVDIQSSFVRWRHQSHILHKKIKSPLPFTPIHLSFRIYVYLCLFYNLINHNLVRHSISKVYSSFWLYNQRVMMT